MSRIPSPQSGRRGCLCKDGTYSIECCDGSFQAQGVGNVTGTIETPSAGEYGYRVQKCGHSQKKTLLRFYTISNRQCILYKCRPR